MITFIDYTSFSAILVIKITKTKEKSWFTSPKCAVYFLLSVH